MAAEIKMPQLSDTMHEGKILAWKKNEGEKVVRGDIIAEVETDKANLEIECFSEGTLLKIMIPMGSVAKVGEVIAVVGAPGESVEAKTPAPKPAAPQTPAQAQPEAAKPPQAAQAQPSAHAAPPAGSNGRIKVSPLARKVAEQRNIDLSVIKGSGPSGRIILQDIEGASTGPAQATPAARNAPATQPTAQQQRPQASSPGGSLRPFPKMRETIARRMVESVTQAPHFYVTTAVNMGEANRLRLILKEKTGFEGISINHLVIKAAAYALENEPRVNCAVKEGQIYDPGQINVGVITAIPDGLLIPVIKDANQLSLRDLVFEARAAVDRARAGRPNATDLVGGTFSISNMGMYDVENFTAIINPGQGAVLAVSSMKEEPIVEKGQIVTGLIMRVTVSVDHRIIDGIMAGNFLKFLKEGLETPALLM